MDDSKSTRYCEQCDVALQVAEQEDGRRFCSRACYWEWMRGRPNHKSGQTTRVCQFEGCERKHFGRGYCHSHYLQWRRGITLRPIRSRRPVAPKGQGYCSKCSCFKPESDFGWDAQREQFKRLCKPCASVVQKASIERILLVRWGRGDVYVSREAYDAMYEEQDGKCAICAGTDEDKGRRLSLDHCHINGHYRGLLCANCNLMLGHCKDQPSILEQAAEYLRKHNIEQ